MPLASDCLSRAGLRDLAATTLRNAQTLAGYRVTTSHVQPSEPGDLPEILVATPAERKDTYGSGAPQFGTVITLAIMIRAAGQPHRGDDDASEFDAEAQLDLMIEQVQRAILCTPAMVEQIERFEFVETLATISAETEDMIGEATIMFGCRVYQLYEPDAGDLLTEIVLTVPPNGSGAPVTLDLPLPQ